MRLASLMLAFLLVLMPVMASAQRSSVGGDFPIYDNGGKPDLTIDPKRFVSQMEIIDRYFDPIADQCVFDEFAVGAPGWRRLLRFDTVLINGGDGDLVVGDLGVHAANVHYSDWFERGAIRFDYRMRPGVVRTSNALELMRAVGLLQSNDELGATNNERRTTSDERGAGG